MQSRPFQPGFEITTKILSCERARIVHDKNCSWTEFWSVKNYLNCAYLAQSGNFGKLDHLKSILINSSAFLLLFYFKKLLTENCWLCWKSCRQNRARQNLKILPDFCRDFEPWFQQLPVPEFPLDSLDWRIPKFFAIAQQLFFERSMDFFGTFW